MRLIKILSSAAVAFVVAVVVAVVAAVAVAVGGDVGSDVGCFGSDFVSIRFLIGRSCCYLQWLMAVNRLSL